MLAGHEVGHALWTDRVRLDVTAKRIDPKNIHIAAAYVNIVEDARIERLIKALYPGLRIIFDVAYEDLFNRFNMGKHSKHMCFIDRANLHFKVGRHVNLEFTDVEKAFLKRMEETVTFSDVIDLTKEIYEYARSINDHPDPIELSEELIEELAKQQKSNPSQDEDEEDEDEGDGPVIEIPINNEDEGEGQGEENEESEDKSKESPKPGKDGKKEEKEPGEDGKDGPEDTKNGKGSSKADKESGSGDEDDKESTGDDDGECKDSKKDGKDKKPSKKATSSTSKKKTKPVPPGPPPAPTTQQKFDEEITKLNDEKAEEIVYVTLPKPNLSKIIEDYPSVHERIRSHFVPREEKGKIENPFEQAERELAEFRRINNDKINYIFTQFEMKKQADQYKRTKIHKTGSLDTLRLHAYKYEEDLFKSISTVADAKNHALLFIIDWSGSMSSSMAGTIEQLISLTLFCRKAQIPFEVYSLTTGTTHFKAFEEKPGNLKYSQNFKMRCYLSSRMNQNQYYAACVNLFALMPKGVYQGGAVGDSLIGCTPLDEAVTTAIDLIKELRNRTKAQIVNAIFLTDGGANTVSEYIDENGRTKRMHGKNRYVVEDQLTRKHYEFSNSDDEMTPVMLEILRDRQNINVVGFYVTQRLGYALMLNLNEDDDIKTMEKQFDQDGYVVCSNWGFNELYILKGGENLRIKEVSLEPKRNGVKVEPGTPEFLKLATENLAKRGWATRKQRLMLDRFVKLIA